MKRTGKRIAFLCLVIMAAMLFVPILAMKVKASTTQTVTLEIELMESLDSDPYENMQVQVTATNFVDNMDDTYAGTINLANENITYAKNRDDVRHIIGWYNDDYISMDSVISLSDVPVEKGGDASNPNYTIRLCALYGKTIKIEYDNNAAYMNEYMGTSVTPISAAKYYPQKDASITEETIIFPNPATLPGDFTINGYTFKGWGEYDSGDVEISEITLRYGDNNKMYAHWLDLRPQENTITGAGQYYLEPGTAYSLGSGSWTVNGGSTKYTGGITFYVNSAGTYTFSK